MVEHTDILVVGGGIAGLAATISFGAAGFSTICIDPVHPTISGDSATADWRTTAYLQPGRDFLDRVGIWPHVQEDAQGLRTMRIVDLGNAERPVTRDFVSDEISDRPFAWNVANWRMRGALMARVAEVPCAQFRPGLALDHLVLRSEEAHARLSDGSVICAKLIIGADGRDSAVRRTLGIDVRCHRFAQSALSFAVTHPDPHHHISSEVHRSGGPFTLVPLPDHQGQPCSAVVWMDDAAEIARLKGLSDGDVSAAASERSGGISGPLKAVTARASWPIVSQLASDLIGPRTAIVAEAAHVLPPIGAQGLNMSLKDIECLVRLTEGAKSVGDHESLKRYRRERLPRMGARLAGVSALNLASMADGDVLRRARAMGLSALHEVGPMRRSLMRLGLGSARGNAS